MAQLKLSCLGPFELTLAQRPVTDFKSNKVRALLAYLMVEAERPHPRDVLAGLLWPDWPDRDALSNLRYALSNLRKVTGDRTANPPYLLISRDTLKFNQESDHWFDVSEFMEKTGMGQEGAHRQIKILEDALNLYRGSFLNGFSIKDSVPFEDWLMVKRRQIDQQMFASLRFLAADYEERGEYEKAMFWVRKHIDQTPWDEAANRRLMRILALSGQRSAALQQYEISRENLLAELGVEPATETVDLYEQIRNGLLKDAGRSKSIARDEPVSKPQYFIEDQRRVDQPVFVSRERELEKLHDLLDQAIEGQGRVVFVTGEAGSGKTALLQEFSRQTQDKVQDLCVVSGNCNAYTGAGDPYLPFREMLEMLTGDVEAKWAAGTISSEHARRLWQLVPTAAWLVAEYGKGLINTFVPGTALINRVKAHPSMADKQSLLLQLEQTAQYQPTSGSKRSTNQQIDLFDQYTRIVHSLGQERPLLMVIDDLQWADQGSISLLFHLGRSLSGMPIMILGAYRLEEVSLGRADTRHPLEPVINEFQQVYGDSIIKFNQSSGRQFVDAILDSEPNRLDDSFRAMLSRHTRGHALFTVELLRDLQERGQLVKNDGGYWIVGPELDWEKLPVRVEAAIAERIKRLGKPLREVLQIASVEGEDFTAEVVAHILGMNEREMVARLSSELDRQHRLVRPQVVDRQGRRRISRYRFRNYLFQKYTYENLDEIERAYLHEEVGKAMETLYGERLKDIAVQLAWHYQEAGIADKAAEFLIEAGERALRLSAFKEAISHLNDGFKALPESRESAEQELALQLALGIAWQSLKSIGSPEARDAYLRARDLCILTGERARLAETVGQLAVHHFVHAEYDQARQHAQESLEIARQAGDTISIALAFWYLGFIHYATGDYKKARESLNRVITVYEPEIHHRQYIIHGGKDAGIAAMAYDSCCLWTMGYPDQARRRAREAIELARALDHPFSLADTLCFAGCHLEMQLGNAEALMVAAEELMELGKRKVAGWQGTGQNYLGVALTYLGQYEEGIETIVEALAIAHTKGVWCYLSAINCALASAQAKVGRVDQGLQTLDETLDGVEETGERYWEPELYRTRAELRLLQDNQVNAESDLRTAIKKARQQKAKMWELRATTTLAQLWLHQGKIDKAQQELQQIYDWFTEGFDTRDLVEAKNLLGELIDMS